MQKHILSAFAIALALGFAAPAFADRYDDPADYGVEFQGGNESVGTDVSHEHIASDRA